MEKSGGFFSRILGLRRGTISPQRNKSKEIRQREPETSTVGDIARLNLGIDFGTSYTKVCYRDLGREISGIVDCSQGYGFDVSLSMFPSKLFLDESANHIIAGVPGALDKNAKLQSVDALKMRLANLDLKAQLDNFNFSDIKSLNSANILEDLAAIFLCNVIITSKNWIFENRADLIKGRKVIWSANVGVPAKVYDSPAIDRFRLVLERAWILAEPLEKPVTDLSQTFEKLKAVRTETTKDAIDFHAYPEIAAAVLSYVNSPNAREGMYIYLDIGGGTLDGVSFRYYRDEGMKKIDFYTAEIEPNGVEAILGRHTQIGEEKLLAYLKEYRGSYDLDELLLQDKLEIGNQLGKIAVQTKEKDRIEFQHLDNIPMVLGGGGSSFRFFQEEIPRVYDLRDLKSWGIPQLRPFFLPFPEDLEIGGVDEKEFHRFAIAYGLSMDFAEVPEVTLPDSIGAMPRPPKSSHRLSGVYED